MLVQKVLGAMPTARRGHAFYPRSRILAPPYLYHAAQVPSELTMHGPTGMVGVQALPNRPQSGGNRLPWITSPHRQPGCS